MSLLRGMLGSNRKSVTIVAQNMQAAGIVTYRRGVMQVLDRPGLERASCECYSIVKKRLDAFLASRSMVVHGNTQGRNPTRTLHT